MVFSADRQCEAVFKSLQFMLVRRMILERENKREGLYTEVVQVLKNAEGSVDLPKTILGTMTMTTTSFFQTPIDIVWLFRGPCPMVSTLLDTPQALNSILALLGT